MRYVAPEQNSFVSGEFAPDLHGRTDLKAYANGAKQLLNMTVKRQGGAVRRSGSLRVTETKSIGANSRLISFRRSAGVNFVLEFGGNYIRFFKNHAPVLVGGIPYEVVTPWIGTEIDDLRVTQSADVLFIAHPAYKPYKLSHFGDTNWTLAVTAIASGPFKPQNIVKTTKITASGATGTVTLTATAAIFAPGDVGGIWKLQYQDASAVAKWTGTEGYNIGNIAISRGKFYAATTNNNSGVNAPDHTEGIESDGQIIGSGTAGVKWLYLHSGYANVTIASYISPTQVTATVETGMTLPADIVTTGTYKWYRAAWSGTEGWPTSVSFFQQRLTFGKGNTLYLSTVADFENFSPTDKHGTVTADAAVTFVISDPKVDFIHWIAPSQAVALVGTSEAEVTLGAQNPSSAFGPNNVATAVQTNHGSVAFLQPERIGDAILFVDSHGRRAYEMTISDTGTDHYASRELSILAPHLLANQAFEAAYCESPDGLYWLITNTGELIGATYEKEQEIIAWHHHVLGGTNPFVESICAIPEPNNRYDELWLQVARVVNGQTVRTIEYLSQPWQDVTDIANAVFADSATVFSGATVSTLTGLSYLEGQTVDVLTDGIDAGQKVVVGGQIVLDQPASRCCVGYGYRSRIETLSPNPGSEVGASQGHRQRIVRGRIRFNRTAHCLFGTNAGPLDVLTLRTGSQPMDAPLTLFSGMREVAYPGGYDEEPTLVIEQNRPLSLEVYGVSWDMTIASR